MDGAEPNPGSARQRKETEPAPPLSISVSRLCLSSPDSAALHLGYVAKAVPYLLFTLFCQTGGHRGPFVPPALILSSRTALPPRILSLSACGTDLSLLMKPTGSASPMSKG